MMDSVWYLVLGWIAAAILVILALGFIDLLMLDGSINDRISRPLRILMICLGPITVAVSVFLGCGLFVWRLSGLAHRLIEK